MCMKHRLDHVASVLHSNSSCIKVKRAPTTNKIKSASLMYVDGEFISSLRFLENEFVMYLLDSFIPSINSLLFLDSVRFIRGVLIPETKSKLYSSVTHEPRCVMQLLHGVSIELDVIFMAIKSEENTKPASWF